MTSKTGIRVGRPFLVTTMLFRSPCRTRVRRLTLPFGRPFGLKSHGRGCWVRPRSLLKRLYSCIRRGFSTPKKSGDAKWCSLQTIWVRDEIYWRRSIHPKCATRRAPSLDRGSLPIRLATCRVRPRAGIEVGIGRRLHPARDAEQRAEGVERVEPSVEAERELIEVAL
jgi:hypothetical protein